MAAADPVFPPDAVEVGRVLGAWGVKGAIKVEAYASDPQALFSSKRWFIRPPEAAGPRPATTWPALLRVVRAKEHGDGVVAEVADLADRDAAQALRGARIYVARSSFPSAGDDEFYWVDLIGLQVDNRQAQALGTVVGLIDTGAHAVLRVLPAEVPAGVKPESAERLIPFVGAYVDSVDLAGRRIVVDWGLDY
jgi:16S rRNA processing protein RimM